MKIIKRIIGFLAYHAYMIWPFSLLPWAIERRLLPHAGYHVYGDREQ